MHQVVACNQHISVSKNWCYFKNKVASFLGHSTFNSYHPGKWKTVIVNENNDLQKAQPRNGGIVQYLYNQTNLRHCHSI